MNKIANFHIRLDSSLFQNRIIPHREIQAADSPRNFRLLRNWLEECCTSHEGCRRGSYSGQCFDDLHHSNLLPFRVIDVGCGDGSQPRLWTTHYQQTGRYMTLSHCWGRIQPPKTTKATVEAYHVAIPNGHLSKTFLDAIRLTRELGERFLWIDSLCIVQDDPSELAVQIDLMGAIFEGSYCTIAATDAKGVDGSLDTDMGLFLSRPETSKTACLLVRDGNTTPGGTHQVFIYERLENLHKELLSLLRQKAWYWRGWVFQERELSRRCIFFTQEIVGWRCNLYCETERTGGQEYRHPRGAPVLKTGAKAGTYDYDTRHRIEMLWESLVEDYSNTKLTYSSDKDKAIKGAMERLNKRFAAVFHFGILDLGAEEDICSQLLWMLYSRRNSLLGRDPGFAYPTWSWLAVDNPVTWMPKMNLTHRERLSDIRFGQSLGDTQQLHISGPGHGLRIGLPVGEIPRFSRFDKYPPEMHFGSPDMTVDSSAKTILSGGNDVIGWVLLDNSEAPDELVAIPLLQYFRLDDEEEPICVEFLALAKLPVQDILLPGETEKYRRVGRGRVIKGTFNLLENCTTYDVVVV